MKKTSKIKIDQITEQLSNSFDFVFDGTTSFTVPNIGEVPKQFNIGLIVGASGSGKSSLLENFGQEEKIEWDNNKAICSHFESATDAQERLVAVGFNSIPSWMKPYNVLSNGEKFRADLARKLKHNAVIDEFTSVVDRNVAKSCSYAIKRYIQEKNLQKIVFASCHYDIVEWLQPNWVYDTTTEILSVGRGSLQRPSIELEVFPCTTDAWRMFSKHHYLSSNINKGARCWLCTWKEVAIAFSSTIPLPSGTVKNAWREHRTVVLPDFQGLGIGVRLSDAIAQIHKKQGFRYFSKTAHPRLGEYRNQSENWKKTSKNEIKRKDFLRENNPRGLGGFKISSNEAKQRALSHANRFCYSHEFIGTQ